jgi:hypothetical protein
MIIQFQKIKIVRLFPGPAWSHGNCAGVLLPQAIISRGAVEVKPFPHPH